MRLPSFLSPLILVACSNGISPIDTDEMDDSGVDVAGPDDTGEGTEIDTDTDTEDTEPANQAPLADAGPNQSGNVGIIVLLDGSASSDPDGDTLSYGWVMTAKPVASNATLINATRVNPQFWADQAGLYTIELTVDDGEATATDSVDVTITAPNDVPIANAGPDQTVTVGALVQLNGLSSTDPEGATLSYSWNFVSRPSGSYAYLSDSASGAPRFTADVSGSYVIQLVVNDGSFDSAPDQVIVVAQSEDDGDCLSCAAARQEFHRRLSLGDAASGPGLALIPLIVLLWQRKRRERTS